MPYSVFVGQAEAIGRAKKSENRSLLVLMRMAQHANKHGIKTLLKELDDE
jgi:hypothetical protein